MGFGNTRSQVRILSTRSVKDLFPSLSFVMGKNSVGKMWAKELSGLVEKLDRAYRSGNAQVSDKQFDQLENSLREIDPQNSCFQQKNEVA